MTDMFQHFLSGTTVQDMFTSWENHECIQSKPDVQFLAKQVIHV